MKSSYGWKSLSQWDNRPPDAFVKYVPIKTALSKDTCRFMLVKITDIGSGVTRHEHVPKDKITPEMLKEADDGQ